MTSVLRGPPTATLRQRFPGQLDKRTYYLLLKPDNLFVANSVFFVLGPKSMQSLRKIGQDIAKEIEKYFEAKINPQTITTKAFRQKHTISKDG